MRFQSTIFILLRYAQAQRLTSESPGAINATELKEDILTYLAARCRDQSSILQEERTETTMRTL